MTTISIIKQTGARMETIEYRTVDKTTWGAGLAKQLAVL